MGVEDYLDVSSSIAMRFLDKKDEATIFNSEALGSSTHDPKLIQQWLRVEVVP